MGTGLLPAIAGNFSLGDLLRDPKRGCGSESPFTPGLGYHSARGYQYDVPRISESRSNKASLGGFLKETALGGLIGGLAGAAFYKVGKGIDKLKESVLPKRGGSGKRLIPGTEGIVTGGDSTKLGKNMMESMDVPKGTSWKGYQAQHIIPVEMAEHPVLQKIGMDLDDVTNGLFLRIPANDVSTMSRHRGYHSTYNEFVKTQLDRIDSNQNVDVLQMQVYNLQQDLKRLQQSGVPLYPSQGATLDLWKRSLDRIR